MGAGRVQTFFAEREYPSLFSRGSEVCNQYALELTLKVKQR